MDGYSFFYKVRQGLLQIATGITRSTIELLQIARRALLDEVEHDIMNYQNRGLCSASADNTDTRF